MSGRTLLSRPRTRIYDVNYNIGENYYKSTLDRLDQKYNPRPVSPLRSSVAKDILNRHEQAFAEENLSTSRRRAERAINEHNIFDFRRGQIAQRALNLTENDIDEETASTLKSIRANKKVSVLDDLDFESTVNNINSSRLLDRSEKVLRSVGIDQSSRRALDEDVSIKRRSLKVSYDKDGDDLVKWSPLQRSEETAATIRAKQSRDRLIDLEDEMAAVAERQAVRESRAARFKAFVAESTEETEAAQSAIKAVNFKASRESRKIQE